MLSEEEQAELGRQLHAMGHRLFGDDKPLCEACGGTGYSTPIPPSLDLGGNPLPKEHRETFIPYQQVCQVCSLRDHQPTPAVVPDLYTRDSIVRGSCPLCRAEMGVMPQTEQVRKTYENQLLRGEH